MLGHIKVHATTGPHAAWTGDGATTPAYPRPPLAPDMPTAFSSIASYNVALPSWDAMAKSQCLFASLGYLSLGSEYWDHRVHVYIPSSAVESTLACAIEHEQ
jgi:hypothetical protein